jgi:hypothetical protein
MAASEVELPNLLALGKVEEDLEQILSGASHGTAWNPKVQQPFGGDDDAMMNAEVIFIREKALRQFETASRRLRWAFSCTTAACCKVESSVSWARRLSRWQWLDALHDAWTVTSSVVDIATDMLVAVAFYQQGHMVFFYASVAVFAVAQLSYAFLFTGTWAAKRSVRGQVCVFLAVLPFGQLIPVFAWLESFRFAAIDQCLTALHLTPTAEATQVSLASTGGSAAAAAAPMRDGGGADNLWTFIQRKYTAHAGFLAEAFVEAIPQGILQLVAILTLDDTAAVNVFSVLMSISVVASKGYLVAYSIHWPSFAFNYATIAADTFNLFATATWLFSRLDLAGSVGTGGGNSDGGDVAVNPLATHPWLVGPLLAGLCACAVGGLALAVFTMCDDHLKVRRHRLLYGSAGSFRLTCAASL